LGYDLQWEKAGTRVKNAQIEVKCTSNMTRREKGVESKNKIGHQEEIQSNHQKKKTTKQKKKKRWTPAQKKNSLQYL